MNKMDQKKRIKAEEIYDYMSQIAEEAIAEEKLAAYNALQEAQKNKNFYFLSSLDWVLTTLEDECFVGKPHNLIPMLHAEVEFDEVAKQLSKKGYFISEIDEFLVETIVFEPKRAKYWRENGY